MKRYGILLSCEEYVQYNNSDYCHSDTALMFETLTKYCDYDSANLELIMLYIDDDVNTPEEIYKKLTLLIDGASSDDTVMLYFAGHGLKIETDGFLILPNTKPNDIANTSLKLKKINEIMSTSKCNCFVILDACHSGLLSRGDTESLFVETISDKSCVTLASCSENESSYPDDHLEQGVFTYYLSEAIRKSPLNHPLFLDELKIQICEDLKSWCSKNYKQQTPTLVGTIVGNISIATRNAIPYEYDIALEKKEVKTVENTQLEIIPVNNTDIVMPALWQSNAGIEIPKVANLDMVLSFNYQLKQRELDVIATNYKSGFFEMASEAIWNRSIAILRNRVLALGLQFVSEMVGIDNLSYIQNLPDFEVINLAMELGFINATGKMRLTHANEIVQHYLSRDVEDEMPQNESDSVIRPCIQYILGYEDSNIQIEYNDFRTSLKMESFSSNDSKLESLNASPYFYKKTTIRTLVNLLSSTEGAEFETVEANFILIIKTIWNGLTSDDKYFLGLTFSKHKNDGNAKLISAFTNVLMAVGGFDYVPENLRSLSFIEAAKKLKSTHYAMNNFYNEPNVVNKLNKMGSKIPKPAIKECISATLMVLLGNAYGRSFDAVEPATNILQKLSQSDWIYYIEQCLIYDEEVLQKISAGDMRTERWCGIVKDFNLITFEYSNPKVQEFIKFSMHLDKSNTKVCANSFYKKLR